MRHDASEMPALLADAQRRFHHWRSTRTTLGRTPPDLWALAVRCGEEFGVYNTVRALGLDYKVLKRRVEEARGGGAAAKPAKRPPRFVEIPPPCAAQPAECTVELVSPRGTKLRLELRGAAVPDLVALARRVSELDA